MEGGEGEVRDRGKETEKEREPCINVYHIYKDKYKKNVFGAPSMILGLAALTYDSKFTSFTHWESTFMKIDTGTSSHIR